MKHWSECSGDRLEAEAEEAAMSQEPFSVVVTRANAQAPESIQRSDNFAEAGCLWRQGQRAMNGPGGYSVWLYDGLVWRRSGLLDDLEAAFAIRERGWCSFAPLPVSLGTLR